MNFVSIITSLDISSKYERIDNIKWISSSVPEDVQSEMRKNSRTFRLPLDMNLSHFSIREVLPDGYTVSNIEFYYKLVVVRVKIEDEIQHSDVWDILNPRFHPLDVWDILIRESFSMFWTVRMRKHGLPLSKLQYKVLDKLSISQTKELRMLIDKIDNKILDIDSESDLEVEYVTNLVRRTLEGTGYKLVSIETMSNQRSSCHHITLDKNGKIVSFFVKNLSVFIDSGYHLSETDKIYNSEA